MEDYKINITNYMEYDRFANIQNKKGDKFFVHFIEYDDYSNISNDIMQPYNIKGTLCIELVCNSKKCDNHEELMYNQTINNSSHINAIVDVKQVLDEYTILASSNIVNYDIVVAFEDKIAYNIGDRIYIEGSLELKQELTLEESIDDYLSR